MRHIYIKRAENRFFFGAHLKILSIIIMEKFSIQARECDIPPLKLVMVVVGTTIDEKKFLPTFSFQFLKPIKGYSFKVCQNFFNGCWWWLRWLTMVKWWWKSFLRFFFFFFWICAICHLREIWVSEIKIYTNCLRTDKMSTWMENFYFGSVFNVTSPLLFLKW